jgi:hypothetical protein
MRVKTDHVHPATCNLAHWLTRLGSPTIYRCFALPQLLYRWRHQSGIFWIHPRASQETVSFSLGTSCWWLSCSKECLSAFILWVMRQRDSCEVWGSHSGIKQNLNLYWMLRHLDWWTFIEIFFLRLLGCENGSRALFRNVGNYLRVGPSATPPTPSCQCY